MRDIADEDEAANLLSLPALRQHEGDAGHYVTCGHVVTYDPDTGIDNMGIQRLWVRGERLMGCYMLETSHNMINLRKFWEKGEPCPVAVWVGPAPRATTSHRQPHRGRRPVRRVFRLSGPADPQPGD